MSISVSINGPRYALIGQTVGYDLTIDEPVEAVIIEWYKDDVYVPLLPVEDPLRLNLFDIGYPAAGEYYCVVYDKETGDGFTSNKIVLEIGTEPRNIQVTVQSRTLIRARIGETITLSPECNVRPPYCNRICRWSKDGVQIGTDEHVQFVIKSDADFGQYILTTTAWANGYNTVVKDTALDILPIKDELVCPVIYVHDLKPGRNAGYIWIGWWVLDEIVKANKDGFDWVTYPTDDRFKYKCELSRLSAAFSQYPEMDVQESRNGYVLSKSDLQ